MYSKEQIIFLMSSGFSLDEIMQMQDLSLDPQPVSDPQSVSDPQPTPDPQPVPDPQPDNNAEILRAITGLTQAIQMSNIRNNGFGAPPEVRDVNTILGEIINPPGSKK